MSGTLPFIKGRHTNQFRITREQSDSVRCSALFDFLAVSSCNPSHVRTGVGTSEEKTERPVLERKSPGRIQMNSAGAVLPAAFPSWPERGFRSPSRPDAFQFGPRTAGYQVAPLLDSWPGRSARAARPSCVRSHRFVCHHFTRELPFLFIPNIQCYAT